MSENLKKIREVDDEYEVKIVKRTRKTKSEANDYEKKFNEGSCTYCAESYTEFNPDVTCFACKTVSCSECLKEQLVTNMKTQDYSCPNCKVTFTRKFLLDSFGTKFVNKTLVDFKKQILFDAFLPHYESYEKYKKVIDFVTDGYWSNSYSYYPLDQLIRISIAPYTSGQYYSIKDILMSIRMYLYRLEVWGKTHDFTTFETDFLLSNTLNLQDSYIFMKSAEKAAEHFQFKYSDIEYPNKLENGVTIETIRQFIIDDFISEWRRHHNNQSKAKIVMVENKKVLYLPYSCSSPTCSGNVSYPKDCPSEMGIVSECDTCRVKHCARCFRVHEKPNEVCLVKNLKIADEFRENTILCPTCSILIQRSSGCNHMFCVMCKTKFDWATGSIYTNTNSYSNPLHTQYIQSLQGKRDDSHITVGNLRLSDFWSGPQTVEIYTNIPYILVAFIKELHSVAVHIVNTVFDACQNLVEAPIIYRFYSIERYQAQKIKKDRLLTNFHKNYKEYEKYRDIAFAANDWALNALHMFETIDYSQKSSVVDGARKFLLDLIQFRQTFDEINHLYDSVSVQFLSKHFVAPVATKERETFMSMMLSILRQPDGSYAFDPVGISRVHGKLQGLLGRYFEYGTPYQPDFVKELNYVKELTGLDITVTRLNIF